MSKPTKHRQFEAQRRARDFQAGIEAAKHAIAPLIMRKYFLRGMGAGAALVAFAFVTALVIAAATGAIVFR